MEIIANNYLEENLFIEELVRNEQKAFRNLVELYKDRVYNTCLGLLQNESDAEDITQEVFVEIYLSIKHFRSKSKLSTWIYRITISKALDLIRKKKRKKRFAFITNLFDEKDKIVHEPKEYVHPGIQAENKELSIILFRAISKLPEKKPEQNLIKINNKNHF